MINKVFILLFIGMLMTNISFSQSQPKKVHSTHVNYGNNIDAPLTQKELSQITEVYGSEAEKYVLNIPQRLKDIKHILRNRVHIVEYPGKDLSSFKKLSQVPLFNEYNKSLKRDLVVDKNNFNPLKYQFQFFSKESYKIRVDNTQYLIIINSQFD
ncbi:hypothetical protein [Winogradskyella sp. 3972H.M.0a.05]|uniref:hypothetical protein n=1 Tax=Winogradskyella sp. 3972H.M.0a.05 TaxID=2950277 RepID=UPI0033971F1C